MIPALYFLKDDCAAAVTTGHLSHFENVRRNYLNRRDHTQECAAFIKPYYGAQPRICYKHRKWIVDGTDLRTFRRDHTGPGGHACYRAGRRLEERDVSPAAASHTLQVIPAAPSLASPASASLDVKTLTPACRARKLAPSVAAEGERKSWTFFSAAVY